PHVLALCRNTELESRSSRKLTFFSGRPEGNRRFHFRQQGLFQIEIRKWRASRPTCSSHGNPGPHPHLRGYGRGATRSRRNRHQDRSERPSHRHLLLVGSRGPVREHHVFGRAHHAYPQRFGGFAAGRKIADQESRQSHARTAFTFV